MVARLIGEEGLLKELVLNLEEGDHWTIGRDPDSCELLVEDPSVSRQQARCTKTENGILIENLSTTNATKVNDKPLTDSRILKPGDLIRIGDTLFRFYSDDVITVFEEDDEEEKKELDKTLFSTEGLFKSEPKLAEINFDLLDTGKWLLKVISGPNNGAEFSMQTGTVYTLGTDPNACDIVFQDNSVSRQHARLAVSQDEILTIEDLNSRNGTLVDNEKINGKVTLNPNAYVVMGTTSFVVYDREGEMQTIISPLLPSIVKSLTEEKKEPAVEIPKGPSEAELAAERERKEAAERAAQAAALDARQKQTARMTSLGILGSVLAGILIVVGIGITSLFQDKPIVQEQVVDYDKALADVLSPFSSVKYTFSRSTGRLLLVGHVLTASDKNQLLYGLQGLNFLSDVDDTGVIIDEYVWNEANQSLLRNPDWRGVSVQAPTPGHFILTGYLKNRDQAQDVWNYMSRNFDYLDLLENKIVVEEDLIAVVNNALIDHGFSAVKAQLTNGELILSGNTVAEKRDVLNKLVEQFQKLQGIRMVKNLVADVRADQAVRNITDQYKITGSSTHNGKTYVDINNRIVTLGDIIDGKQIILIKPHSVLLQDDASVEYRIDY